MVAVISSGISLRHTRHWRQVKDKLDNEPLPLSSLPPPLPPPLMSPITSDAEVEAMEISGITPTNGAAKHSSSSSSSWCCCWLSYPPSMSILSKWQGETIRGKTASSSTFDPSRTGENVDDKGTFLVTSESKKNRISKGFSMLGKKQKNIYLSLSHDLVRHWALE